MFKKLIFFISLITLINLTNFTVAEIIPLKKPNQTKIEKEQKLLIDVLKPLPKPIPKKLIEKIDKKTTEKKVLNEGKKLDLILPKKKPLIAGSKKAETVKKSKYYSKKDFALAKKAILEMKQAKWPNALKNCQ